MGLEVDRAVLAIDEGYRWDIITDDTVSQQRESEYKDLIQS